MNIPDYETRISEVSVIGPFYKLLLLRSLRMDRCMLMCKWMVRNTEEMGPAFVGIYMYIYVHIHTYIHIFTYEYTCIYTHI
jgi:hypothetical protein